MKCIDYAAKCKSKILSWFVNFPKSYTGGDFFGWLLVVYLRTFLSTGIIKWNGFCDWLVCISRRLKGFQWNEMIDFSIFWTANVNELLFQIKWVLVKRRKCWTACFLVKVSKIIMMAFTIISCDDSSFQSHFHWKHCLQINITALD